MKTVMIFGAGMMGRAARRLLEPRYRFLGFLDNRSPEAYRPEKVTELEPDCVILGVRDDERAGEMAAQLRSLGYEGEIIGPAALNYYDPRAAVMRLMANNAPEGAVAELGVFRGDFACAVAEAYPGREMHLFDTFEGFDGRDLLNDRAKGAKNADFSGTSAEAVQARLPEAVIHKGWFPDTFAGCEGLRFAFVSLDADLYAPTKAGLELFWPRLNKGGSIIVHDCLSSQFPDVKTAVDEFCAGEGIIPVPLADPHGSVVIVKN